MAGLRFFLYFTQNFTQTFLIGLIEPAAGETDPDGSRGRGGWPGACRPAQGGR